MKSRLLWLRKVFTLCGLMLFALVSSLGPGYSGVVQAAATSAADCVPAGTVVAVGGPRQAILASTLLGDAASACPDGLISLWKLDETSGTSFADSANGHNAGCTTGCPSAATGVVHGALTFGAATTVTVAANAAFNFGLASSFSVEAWIKLPVSASCTPQPAIGRASPGVTQMQWWLGCDGGKAEFVLKDKVGHLVAPAGTTTLTDGNFHHLVGVRDATANEVRLYVDGTLETTLSSAGIFTTGFDSASPIDIGWYKSAQTYHLIGSLDEVALYSRALSSGEIAQHHTGGLAGRGICEVALTLFLPMLYR